jgi:hypothetical protein
MGLCCFTAYLFFLDHKRELPYNSENSSSKRKIPHVIHTAILVFPVGILPRQGKGQVDLATPLSQILLVQRPAPGSVILEQSERVAGPVVNRSLSSLPERTVSCVICTSMSWTLSRGLP